jgi:hypothetical protein
MTPSGARGVHDSSSKLQLSRKDSRHRKDQISNNSRKDSEFSNHQHQLPSNNRNLIKNSNRNRNQKRSMTEIRFPSWGCIYVQGVVTK